MAPKRHYKGTRKMIDGQIGISANLTKLLFQLLQMIHHISVMRKQAEGSPVNAFLHKIAELDRFIRPARPNSDVIKRIQTLNRSWAKQVGVIVHNHYLTNLNSIISPLKSTRASKDEMSRARYTALSWARHNFARQEGEGTDTAFPVTSAAPLHRNQPVHTTSAVPVQRTFEGHTLTQSKTDAQLRQHSAHGTNSHSGNGAKFSGKPLVFTNSNGRNVRSQNVRGVGITPAPPLRSRPPNSGRFAAFEQNNPTTRVGTNKVGPSKVMFQKHRAAPQNYEKEFLPSSVDVIGDIRRWNDPVSSSFPCQVCFRDAFGGACFPSGTHALM